METGLLLTLASLLCAALGVIISWLVFSRSKKKDSEAQGENRGAMASDIGYIKAGIDDLKYENRSTKEHISQLEERVTRCEESTKSAHKRIDEVHDELKLH